MEKSEPQVIPKLPQWNFKKQTGNSTKNCLTILIPETNTNQDGPIIHFTNTFITIANKTILKTTLSLKYTEPWFTEECKGIRECQTTLRKFLKSQSLNKYKQAKIQGTIKKSSWRIFTTQIGSSINPKLI